MDEDSVLKEDAEKSNSSRTSSTSEAISSSVKNIDPFTFVEVKCEIEVSICVKVVSVHFELEVTSLSSILLYQQQVV
jgi:hypothetical protein